MEERKLFVGMIPTDYTDKDLTAMFDGFGTIKEIHKEAAIQLGCSEGGSAIEAATHCSCGGAKP